MRSSKMEAAGRLAGGVAHEFNNLLTAIGGYADLVLARIPEDESIRSDVEAIKKAAGRATALTRQLLAFSRAQILSPQLLRLDKLLPDLGVRLAGVLGDDIPLSLVTAEDTGMVSADPGQIENAIVELATNAREAMTDGGRLTIETAREEIEISTDLPHDRLEPGSYVRLSVIDSGPGMDEQTAANCFEPFFTTKTAGNGMGLSTVYGIVKQSGGAITAASAPGHGTRFDIYLPVVGVPPRPSVRAPEAPGAEPGTATILVVEDEAIVRKLVEKVLEPRGYTVLTAEHAGEALICSETHPGPIDLLLTDVVMPQMGGPELAEWLSPLRPEMRVLFMSGHADDSVAQMGALEPGTFFIHKPFSAVELEQKVREVLASVPCAAPPLC